MYQAFYVSRVSWASESVEKKTISAKSGFTLKITFGALTNTATELFDRLTKKLDNNSF